MAFRSFAPFPLAPRCVPLFASRATSVLSVVFFLSLHVTYFTYRVSFTPPPLRSPLPFPFLFIHHTHPSTTTFHPLYYIPSSVIELFLRPLLSTFFVQPTSTIVQPIYHSYVEDLPHVVVLINIHRHGLCHNSASVLVLCFSSCRLSKSSCSVKM